MQELYVCICVWGYIITQVARELITYHCHAVFPSSYFEFFPAMSVNGSSATGNCSSFAIGPLLVICDAPASSVLFDGNIPTLTGLEGDMWASQLLTLQTTNQVRRNITFDFRDTPGFIGVARVELVMFNCPEWGISVQTVTLLIAPSLSGGISVVRTITPSITSCDSLVRICILQNILQPVIALEFIPPPGSTWTHLAEVTFYGGGSCQPDIIITTPPPDTIITTPPPDTIITTPPPDTTTPPQPSTTATTTPTTTSLIENDSKHTWAAAASNVEPHACRFQAKP